MPMSCNSEALQAIERLALQGSGMLYIYGAESCGKSHLLHLAAERLQAALYTPDTLPKDPTSVRSAIIDMIDEANPAQQEQLFHLYNHIKSSFGIFIVAARTPAQSLMGLPDLTSRLNTINHVALKTPDTSHLELLLVKFAADRQLQIDPAVIRFLLLRAERSPQVLEGIMDKLDVLSLTDKRPVTIPLAKQVIEQVTTENNHANC